MNWFKMISVGSYVVGWFTRAARDGKITDDEIKQLVTELVDTFGFSVKLPDGWTLPSEF